MDHLEKAIEKISGNRDNLIQRFFNLKMKIIENGLISSSRLDKHISELERIKYTKKHLIRNKEINPPSSIQQHELVKYENSNSLTIPNEAFISYKKRRFSEVINIFEKSLINITDKNRVMSSQELAILSSSIKNDNISSTNQLKRIIELVREKTKSQWSINSQIDIFFRLIQVFFHSKYKI